MSNAYPTGGIAAASPGMQRALRKMSVNPAEPRIFTQATIMLLFGVPITIIGLALFPAFFTPEDYADGAALGIPFMGWMDLVVFVMGFFS